jgi:hypothetical protein
MARRKRSSPRKRTQTRRTQPQSTAAYNTLDIFEVLYLPDAEAELNAIEDRKERVAVVNAVEKLKRLGPRLRYPHSSQVKGPDGKRLRELRPRAGRSPWRALYRQVTADTFVIAALVPEAAHNERLFRRGAKNAQKRLSQIELD